MAVSSDLTGSGVTPDRVPHQGLTFGSSFFDDHSGE